MASSCSVPVVEAPSMPIQLILHSIGRELFLRQGGNSNAEEALPVR